MANPKHIQQVLNFMALRPPGDLLFIVLDSKNLEAKQLTDIQRLALYIAELNPEGYMTIKNRDGGDESGNYIDLTTKIAEMIGADLNDPTCRGLKCTCPTRCDCQDYENGLVSNECPIHNEEPQPSLECPQHGHPLFLD